jgi:tetratricopeptide (TPR) repeat protein
VRTFLGRAYLHSGRPELALEEFGKRQGPAPGSYRDVAQALAKMGRRDEAIAELNRVLEISKQRHVQAIDIATIYASLGDRANALRWLELGYEDRSTNLGFVVQDPAFDNMRDEPRFVALIEKVGVWQLPIADAGKARY